MGSKLGTIKVAAKQLGITLGNYLAHIENNEKHCRQCRYWKPIVEFALDRSRGDGHKSKCFECDRVKQRKSTKGRISAFKGREHTDETRQKMSEAQRNRPRPKGKSRTPEQRAYISQMTKAKVTMRGSNHHSWKGGIKPINEKIRHSNEYVLWRLVVFTRDNFTCQNCGDNRGGNLNAHHIKPFAAFPSLRFEISNGITLCETCHENVHKKS